MIHQHVEAAISDFALDNGFDDYEATFLKEGERMKMKKLEHIRNYLIDNIMLEPKYMYPEQYRGSSDNDIDLIEVIASLYEELHYEVMGEHYDYMFHWANKCGSWVNSDLFEKGVFDV